MSKRCRLECICCQGSIISCRRHTFSIFPGLLKWCAVTVILGRTAIRVSDVICDVMAGERLPRHRLQRKLLASDPDMHHGTCVTHVPWCMSGSLNRSGGENVAGIPGACATRNFTYLARGPCRGPLDSGPLWRESRSPAPANKRYNRMTYK